MWKCALGASWCPYNTCERACVSDPWPRGGSLSSSAVARHKPHLRAHIHTWLNVTQTHTPSQVAVDSFFFSLTLFFLHFLFFCFVHSLLLPHFIFLLILTYASALGNWVAQRLTTILLLLFLFICGWC